MFQQLFLPLWHKKDRMWRAREEKMTVMGVRIQNLERNLLRSQQQHKRRRRHHLPHDGDGSMITDFGKATCYAPSSSTIVDVAIIFFLVSFMSRVDET